jgi:hypothetical protein
MNTRMILTLFHHSPTTPNTLTHTFLLHNPFYNPTRQLVEVTLLMYPS